MECNEFSYGGIESSTYGITCDRETHHILPEQRSYTQEIPGVDGVIDFGIGGYGVRIITLDIYYDGPYETLRANREQIIAWLYSKQGEYKQLEFGDQPGKYYMAKILAALDFTNANDRKIGAVQFTCNPPWQYQNGIVLTPDEIAWNTQDSLENVQWMKEFAASGSMRFTNTGTQSVKPVIKLIGNIPSGTLLTYGSSQFEYDAALQNDGIIIDCSAETVTRMSDGSNLFGNVNSSKDAFFELASGQCEIDVGAAGLSAWPNSLIMLIEFNPQNLG